MSFRSDTEVSRVDGALVAEVCPAWEGAPQTPNGGYLAAIALRAAGLVHPELRPASLHCTFLNRANYGRAEVQLSELRASSKAVCLHVALVQASVPVLHATVWLTAASAVGYDFQSGQLPDTRSPDSCRNMLEGPIAPCWNTVEFRSPSEDPVARGPSEPFFRGWHRFKQEEGADDAFLSAGRLLFLADMRAFGPVVCQQGKNFFELPHFAATLDLHGQFFESSGPDSWLLMDAQVDAARAACLGSRVEAWSEQGRRLASFSVTNLCRPNPFLSQRR